MNKIDLDEMFTCYGVIREMLNDRGYLEDEEDNVTKKQIKYATSRDEMKKVLDNFSSDPSKTMRRLRMIRHHAMYNKTVYVFFVGSNIGVKEINYYDEVMVKHDPPVNHAILISVFGGSTLTPFALGRINELNQENGKIIENFHISSLQFNITKHELQPKKMEICTQEEKVQVLSGYGAKECQLQAIPKDDSLAKYFGLQVGDVLKCVRYSESVGNCNYYRICIDPDL